MKVAFITDIHWGARSNSPYYMNNLVEFFDKVFFPYIIKNKIKKVIMLGDIFERRKDINFYILHHTKKHFLDRMLELKLDVKVIYGNHDIFYRNTSSINSIDLLLGSYSNIEIVNNHKVFEYDGIKIGLIGWIHSGNYEDSIDWLNKVEADVIGGHFEIKSFEVSRGQPSNSGLDPSIFNRFNMVLSGHFHIPSTNGIITYIGNTNQTNWGDYKVKKGFTILDTKNMKLELIENTINVYEIVDFNDSIDIVGYDYEQFNNKVVKIMINSLSSVNRKLLDLFVDKITSVSYSVDIQEREQVKELIGTTNVDVIPQPVSTIDKINQFINNVDSVNINKDKLSLYFSDIYTEAVNNSRRDM